MIEKLHSGTAIGGPMDGCDVEGRFPSGIVFVDKPSDTAWIYDYFPDEGEFYVRPLGYDTFWDEMSTEQKLAVIEETVLSGMDSARIIDSVKLFRAADGSTYEVRAIPGEVS